jgi:ferredoxin
MCEFCASHGDGATWYLNAENYAYDLASDLERRGYVVDFFRSFDERVPRLFSRIERLAEARPDVEERGSRLLAAHQRETHWGQPLPIEDCERIFDLATNIVQVPCACRRLAGTPERGYCLAISTQPLDDVLMEAFPDYAEGPDSDGFQRLGKEEALALLRRTEELGMMHSVWTFMTPFIAGLCNCNLESGCVAMRLAVEYESPNMWRGEYAAHVDEESCTGCRACVDLCPFGVIEHDRADRKATVDPASCWGCGTCRVACDEGALRLRPRSKSRSLPRS